jgi:hypothetical protein
MTAMQVLTVVGTVLGVVTAMAGLCVSLGTIAGVFVIIGRERQRLADYGVRLAENTARLQKVEDDSADRAEWQAMTTKELQQIQATLREIKDSQRQAATDFLSRMHDELAQRAPSRRG